MSRCLVPLLPALLALACCEAPPPPVGQSRADAATLAACREHADAVYNRQNRETIYSISSPNAPYSANYTPGVTTRGLAQRFDYDTMTRDCVRNTGTQTDRTAGSAAPEAAPEPAQAKP
jgi:hypothetical protein